MPGAITFGLEFAVNTYTAANQTSPSIAAFGDGGFVVVWGTLDTTQDGSESAIKAQRYDAAGQRVGSEFLVNNVPTSHQYTAEVATFADGGFVVTWVSHDNSAITGVRARIFDVGGAPVGPEFVVYPEAISRYDDPHITVLEDGNFVISFNDWNSFDMRAQIFTATGERVGYAFQLNAITDSAQEYGDVVALAGGGFVATWRTTDTRADGNGQAVIARIFDSAGIGGPEIVVNSATTLNQNSPRLAALADGGFVIAWYTTDAAQDGSSGAIKAQRFNAAGERIGSEFLVNTQGVNDQSDPVVAARADGGFMIVWETLDPLQDGSGMALKGQYFGEDGQKIGDEFLVNNGVTDGQFLPELESLANGQFAAVWTSASGDGSGYAVRGRLFDLPSPTIVSNGGGAGGSISVLERQAAVTTVSATDVDSPVINYAIAGGEDAALFRLDSSTGALVFATAPDFEAPADADGDNVYEVIVTASDGRLVDTQALAITVVDVNDAPRITSGGGGDTMALIVDENSRAVSLVTAHDLDSLALTYSISGGADAERFVIDRATGRLAFARAPDFETAADANHDNVYEVAVTASNGVQADNQAIWVSVSNLVDGVVRIGNTDRNIITGSTGEDTLLGREGRDTLRGGTGTDWIDGGADGDWLIGGQGADIIIGGGGPDLFQFETLADSRPEAPDTIVDFSRAEHDLIYLKAIDANLQIAGNQDFSFIGTAAFSGNAGELRFEQSGDYTLVTGDVDGDALADFAIQVTGTMYLTSGDFTL